MIENKYNFFDILDTYNNTVSKRIKNKKSLIRFESNKMAYISNLYNNLINNRYKYNKYMTCRKVVSGNLLLREEEKYAKKMETADSHFAGDDICAFGLRQHRGQEEQCQ